MRLNEQHLPGGRASRYHLSSGNRRWLLKVNRTPLASGNLSRQVIKQWNEIIRDFAWFTSYMSLSASPVDWSRSGCPTRQCCWPPPARSRMKNECDGLHQQRGGGGPGGLMTWASWSAPYHGIPLYIESHYISPSSTRTSAAVAAFQGRWWCTHGGHAAERGGWMHGDIHYGILDLLQKRGMREESWGHWSAAAQCKQEAAEASDNPISSQAQSIKIHWVAWAASSAQGIVFLQFQV